MQEKTGHYSLEELQDMMADLIRSQKKTDRQFKETDSNNMAQIK